MRLERSWIQLEKGANKIKNRRINVIACKQYIDNFGKTVVQTSTFDDFASVNQALMNKDGLEAQAKNCFDKFEGWML